MLELLSIKNVALIKDLTIEFGKGFNVLMGETGAGKSIIFDSLNFVLGAKVDKSLLRTGESQMKVDAVFSSLNTQTKDFLIDHGLLEEDEECQQLLLSRVFNADGKSTIRINGQLSTSSILKSLGESLVDSYSQHENVTLLKSKNHLAMLDKFGGEKLLEIKNKLFDSYQVLNDLKKKIDALGGDTFERERTKSLLEYQIREIEDAELKSGEDEELKEKLHLMNSAEKINEGISASERLLEENTSSVLDSLQEVESILSSLNTFSKIEECKNRLTSVRYEIEDISETLKDIQNEMSFDEREYEALDRRYDNIKLLTKKYGGSIEKVLEYFNEIKSKYNDLADADYLIEKLEREKSVIEKQLESLANELSAKRKATAKEIEDKIVSELKQLGMKSIVFKVNFEKLSSITSNGYDDVEFVFSANKGQEVKALAKTASGGELSRFMLALKNIFAEIGNTGTLVFDEIDTGISGETGNVVGQKINNLTSFAQVICVTHLPQVASFGDNFFFVSKAEDVNSTYTQIKELSSDEINYQIARMIGGDNVSELALKHAKEMRAKAGK